MINLTCLCGAIHIEAAKAPDFIHACNCRLCSGTGAYWAYYHPS